MSTTASKERTGRDGTAPGAMRAAVFEGPGASAPGAPGPVLRAQRRDRPRDDDDDLRHRRAHPARRVPGRAGPDHRPRARRRDPRARLGGRRLRGRRPRAGRRDHAVRELLLLPAHVEVAVLRARGRVGDDRRLAARQLRSTACRPTTSASPTRRPTSPRSPTTSPTSSACCWPTSPPPASRPRRRANVRIGQTVAVFAQGPIGLCATAGARLKGASLIIGVDAIEKRLNAVARDGRRRGDRLHARRTRSPRSSG